MIISLDKVLAKKALNEGKATVILTPNDNNELDVLINGVNFGSADMYTTACDIVTHIANEGLTDVEERVIDIHLNLPPNVEIGECSVCSELYMKDMASGINQHLDHSGNIDYDLDAVHTAY